MNILRADHLGMCFGVRDAIALAVETARHEPLTILGDLVHNETVLAELRGQGIRFARSPDGVATRNMMITAHGASDRASSQARARGLNVVEATCPLVHVAHRALAKLVAEDFHPVIIGKREHVTKLVERPRFGVVAQTTQPIERVRELVQLVRERFPNSEVRFVDTVCQPTKQRQNAAVELAQQCDVVIVIGGAHSNNTHELVATACRYCSRVHHVQTAEELRAGWFSMSDIVGITAGTSTPDNVIDGIEQWVAQLAQDFKTHAKEKHEEFNTSRIV